MIAQNLPSKKSPQQNSRMYLSRIRLILTYGSAIFSTNKQDLKKLQSVQSTGVIGFTLSQITELDS